MLYLITIHPILGEWHATINAYETPSVAQPPVAAWYSDPFGGVDPSLASPPDVRQLLHTVVQQLDADGMAG